MEAMMIIPSNTNFKEVTILLNSPAPFAPVVYMILHPIKYNMAIGDPDTPKKLAVTSQPGKITPIYARK